MTYGIDKIYVQSGQLTGSVFNKALTTILKSAEY